MSGIGIEHHRSSENGVGTGYFTDWAKGPGSRNLLPHEMTHSWNGKHRRPQGIWAPDFRTPSRDDLLWVYEGQTQFWGYVLGARSGLFTYQDTLDAFASIAAGLDRRAGRDWRPLVDTTHDPIIAARRPKGWTSYQRSEDYYNEGMMIWLEADQIIRRESGNARSLQDFARSFFGGREGDWGVVTYELPDVIAALNAVQPYDWQGFFQTRVFEVTPEVGKQGFVLGGYELVYGPEASNFIRSGEAASGTTDLSHSIGLVVEKDGKIAQVMWGSPAFGAGMTVVIRSPGWPGATIPARRSRRRSRRRRPQARSTCWSSAARDTAKPHFPIAAACAIRRSARRGRAKPALIACLRRKPAEC